jgi:hypothetical protein
MSVEKIIEKLEMVKPFDIKESYLDEYITSIDKYKAQIETIKNQHLPPVDTIKLIDKVKLANISDCCFDYKVIYEMLKSSGKDITLAEVKKYLSYKLK